MIYEERKLWDQDNNAYYAAYLQGNTKGGPVRPAMIVCPGGGFISHTPNETEPVAHYFLGKGYQVFLLYYNVGLEGNAVYPAPLYDIARMVMTLRRNAKAFNIDPNKIAAVGFSAGAALIAQLAVHWTDDWLNAYVGSKPEEIGLNAGILGYGVYDNLYSRWINEQDPNYDAPLKGRDYTKRDINNRFELACIGENVTEEALKKASPYYYVNAKVPPLFLWHTYTDPLASVGHTLNFAVKLHESGCPFEMHIFEKGLHGMSLADQASNYWYGGVENVTGEDVARWKDLACRFLDRHWNKEQ